MPDIYFKSVPFSKEDVTLALESGVDGIITEAEHVEGVRSLALCDVRAEADMPSVGLGSKAEEESIASRIAGGERLVLAQGWEIIPVENLLAQPAVAGKLAVEAASLAEARLAAGVLECGVPVVVVLPEALASLKNIVSELKLSQGILGKLLLTDPDILLLDEPTNHLDLNSISWLETYLMNYNGAVFIVSHDRFFLNRVVTKVIEIENGALSMYMGNYRAYSEKKQQIRDAKLKEYFNQQREIKHQQAVIEKLRSFNREKSIRRAESREKLLEKITIVDKPQEAVREMHFSLEPYCVSGNDVLTVEHLSKQFDTQLLFQDVSFEIKRGEHVAVIGDNGTGKTTLLKILNQVIKADNGSFTLGAKVQIGYYDQEHHVLHDDKTIFEEISDDYPHLTNTEIRNTLAAFQFTGDEVFQVIHSLSGGEKGRVSLAKLMLSEANFLILDEPTNHLDIASKEILEEALNNYTGTILYVSHDRYFINSTASRILELVNQTFVNYIGNYDYYLEKKDELTQTYASSQIQRQVSTSQNGSETVPADGAFLSDSKLSWQEQKEQQAKERKRKSELKKTEDEIALLENRNGEIDFQMTLEEVYSNSVKCQELSTERTKNELRLEELYEKWGELAE